jgi:hypothetical protein
MTELLERKIRLHAQHICDKRGQAEGSALEDWLEAESRVLENSILAPLYRRSRGLGGSVQEAKASDAAEFPAD